MIVSETNIKIKKIDTNENIMSYNIKLAAFKKMKKGSQIFTSLLYSRPKKTIDWLVCQII